MADENPNATEEELAAHQYGQENFVQSPNLNNPYVSPEDQDMDMVPVVMGPPQYGSPDPLTSAGALLPIVDHPLAEQFSEDYGTDAEEEIEAQTVAEEGEENATAGAKELAEAEGVSLSDVEGTGAEGRVTKTDVQNYIASQQSEETTTE